MKLDIQLFGGRGASSSNKGISSFESLVNKRNNMKYSVTFGTGIDISERINDKTTSISSYRIGQLENVMRDINETIIQVQQGNFDKRIKQLNDIGFNVISRTKPDDNEKTSIILAHVKRRK